MENSKKTDAKSTGTSLPLQFTQGLLGFEEISQYTLQHKGDSPVWELTASSGVSPRFVLFEAAAVADRYAPTLPKEALVILQAESEEELSFFAVAVVPDDISKTTVNLRSPIVMNIKAGLAAQIVLESTGYPMRHPVFPTEGGGYKCS
ncbi:Flagellar assembly factor FliW [bioreactor metagenome]|uniref:Flagellar assembly factor FliW n=1 Tax=bioreactor metagenome TaxID=1076179 RepID=A0A644YHI8_9ZZZZ